MKDYDSNYPGAYYKIFTSFKDAEQFIEKNLVVDRRVAEQNAENEKWQEENAHIKERIYS